MTRILGGLAVVVVIMITIPVLLAWSQSRRRLRVERTGDRAVLRMPRGHWALMAAIAILPFASISIAAFLVAWQPGAESSGLVLGSVMGLAGLLSGGYLLALELRGCIRLDDASIEKVGAVGRRLLAWGDVVRITFNPVNNWFFLTGPGGKTIYFGEGLDGIATFAEYALRRLPPKVLEASPEAEQALQDLSQS
jgi:PH (Pleckstrin Homology) domain-containing protein